MYIYILWMYGTRFFFPGNVNWARSCGMRTKSYLGLSQTRMSFRMFRSANFCRDGAPCVPSDLAFLCFSNLLDFHSRNNRFARSRVRTRPLSFGVPSCSSRSIRSSIDSHLRDEGIYFRLTSRYPISSWAPFFPALLPFINRDQTNYSRPRKSCLVNFLLRRWFHSCLPALPTPSLSSFVFW